MKKILTLLFIGVAAIAQAQTADEVLAKYEAASGGREKLQAIKQLQSKQYGLKLSVMGQDLEIPTTLVREKGHLFRRQIGGLMGMGDSYTLITDTSGPCMFPLCVVLAAVVVVDLTAAVAAAVSAAGGRTSRPLSG
jgi:hypothetical protein